MVSQGCHGMHSGEILTLLHPTIDYVVFLTAVVFCFCFLLAIAIQMHIADENAFFESYVPRLLLFSIVSTSMTS